MTLLYAFIGLFALSTCLTGLFRSYALKKQLLDLPNHRSSHTVPTPRGGGVVFVVLFLLAFLVAYALKILPSDLFKALALPAFIIAIMGYCDDVSGLPAKVRFAVQLGAALIFLYVIHSALLGVGAISLLVFIWAIVWSTNLYNFMDGTDGLAAVEALTVYGAGGFLLWHQGAYPLVSVAGIIVATVGGFLVWNWPKAKIFMGDCGSTFLGFLIIPIALLGYLEYGLSLFVWIMLYLFFILDATVTLIRRVLHGDKWHEAHRLHAYQRLHQAGCSHAQVLVTMIGLNLIFSVLALCVAFYSMPILLALLIAVVSYCIFYMIVEYKFPMYPKTNGVS